MARKVVSSVRVFEVIVRIEIEDLPGRNLEAEGFRQAVAQYVEGKDGPPGTVTTRAYELCANNDNGTAECVLSAGHRGRHEDENGARWGNDL